MRLRVARAEPIAEGILSFELRHPDGADLPEFTAARTSSLRVPNGVVAQVFARATIRPSATATSIAVKRERTAAADR